jgi:hypothetical protein
MRTWCGLTDSGSSSKNNPSTGLVQDQRVRPSSVRSGRLYPPGNVRGTDDCQRLSRPQGHSEAGMIIPVTPTGIEPANFRLLPQCLNQLRNRVIKDLVVPYPFALVCYLWIYQGSQYVINLWLMMRWNYGTEISGSTKTERFLTN